MRNLLSLISPIALLVVPGVRSDNAPTPILACHRDPVYSVNGASYLLYEIGAGGSWDAGPSEIQMSFYVANTVNQIDTICELSNFKSNGQDWDDDGTTWHSCQDQVITGAENATFTVKTSTQFDWNLFNVTVNQTWVCDNTPDTPMRPIAGNFSTPLSPSCSSYTTQFVNITECHAPDVSLNGTAQIGS